jgi:hypothetical protein
MTTPAQQDTAQALYEACLEATALFDNYPECHECTGTYQVLWAAIAKFQSQQ